MAALDWERAKRRPTPARNTFKIRFQAHCRQCGGFMVPGTKAVKLPVGVMHAEHARP